ncbi:MAG TPA: sigma-70 family RNA polymerase sigma factor, partial [Gemmataceae bacterium]|nr:sigma-70 family RNA polymerase sigma factor [Gemmataceae bacterium]
MSDAQLWQRSGEGDREAFGRIVERYQSLICSLAYSACGNLAASEDLAQETFLAAWRKLGELREPARLRAWLCGIVRNLAASERRREQRRGGAAQSLDSVRDLAGSDAYPAARAVTQEEADLLWRSLAGLSETYREPMVLFYRQGQSVAEVARSLDLTEEAVKQRLSRGRSMLREELATIVETTLTRTRPTKVFTVAVVAALPAITPSSAGAAVIASAASGKGAVAAKGVLAGISNWAIVGPAIGLLLGLVSAKAAASTGRSPEERACIHRHTRRMTLFCFAMSIALVLALSQVEGFTASPIWVVFGLLAWMAVLVATVTWISSRMHHDVLRIRAATGTDDDAHGEGLAEKGLKLGGPLVYESKLRFLGLPLLAVRCGGTDAGSFRTRVSVGWIALGDVAVSPLLAIGGFAIAPLAVGAVTVGLVSMSLWGAALGVLAFGTVAVGWWAFGLGALG